MKNRKVEVVSYNPQWLDLFKQEANRIQNALRNQIKDIYHIGSTAIPNMPAKPVIDILLVFDHLDAINIITEKLNQLNYPTIRRNVIPYQSFFARREENEISYHLHIFECGDPQIKRHVNFKDYLIQQEDIAKDYAELKIKLANEFKDNITAYVLGKSEFVQKIDAKAKLWLGRKNDYQPANTGPSAKDWSQEKLIKAMVANLNVHMTHFAQYLNQVELIRIPGFTIVNSDLADDTFNYVIDADFSSVEANGKITTVSDYFREKQLPFSWWLSPYDQPENLAFHLENNRYKNTENNTAMYFDLDTWDAKSVSILPELDIVRATDKKTLQDFALVLTNDRHSFQTYFSWIASILTKDDPIEYYVGYVDGEPVVRGLTCYFAQLAGLHWLSTAPHQRKKGYGAAMQHFRFKRAKELGYHVAVLQASSDGLPLYQKLGYKACGVFREFKLNLK